MGGLLRSIPCKVYRKLGQTQLLLTNLSAREFSSSGFIFVFSLTLPAFTKRTVTPDSPSIKEDATSLPMDGTSPKSKKEDHESKNSKM